MNLQKTLSYALLFLSVVGNCTVETDNTRESKAKGEDVTEAVVNIIRNSVIFPDDHGFLKRIACVESKYGDDPNTFEPKNGVPYYGGIWQVDEIGFEEGKNFRSHPSLKAIYDKIRNNNELEINWPNVSWSELWKPLYSGLAARLLLSTINERIPDTLEKQAEYWKKYYNGQTGKGNTEKFIKAVKECNKYTIKAYQGDRTRSDASSLNRINFWILNNVAVVVGISSMFNII